MNRRTYLRCGAAVVAAVPSSGCTGPLRRQPADESSENTPQPMPESATIDGSFRAARTAAGTTVEDFESTDGEWAQHEGETSIVEGGPSGDGRCLRLTAAPGSQQVLARREFEHARAFDDRSFSLAVQWRRAHSRFAVVRLTLRDATGDAVRFAQGVDTKHIGEWQRLDVGVAAVDGDPDLSNVVTLDVSVWAGSAATDLLVDEIRTTPAGADGAVILCFDDIRESAYSTAAPVLREHDFVGVGGVITEAVGQERHLDLEQMRELAGRGWEFCSHPQYDDRPLPSMSEDELRRVLGRYRRWLLDHGFSAGARTVIYPFGLLDDATLRTVADYHHLGLLAHGQTPYGPALTEPLLGARVGGTELERIHRAIQCAAAFNAVIPIMYHAVGTEDGIPEAEFKETVRRIDDAGLSTITTSEWLSRMKGGDE